MRLFGHRRVEPEIEERFSPMQSGASASDHRQDSGFRALDVRGTEPDVRTFIFPSGIARNFPGVQRSNGPIPFTGFLNLADAALRPIWRHVPVVDRAGKLGILRSGGVIAPGASPSQLERWKNSQQAPLVGDGPGVWSGVAHLFVTPSTARDKITAIPQSFSLMVD